MPRAPYGGITPRSRLTPLSFRFDSSLFQPQMNFNTFVLLALFATASAVEDNRMLAPLDDNDFCIGMQPICTSETYIFSAQTDSTISESNFYDCLVSQPNPAWYYLKIADPGRIVMSLTAPSDIDYIVSSTNDCDQNG
jgi:hypothetical protein